MARRSFVLGPTEDQFTHVGNARRFCAEYEGLVHWVMPDPRFPDGYWVVWDGRVWVGGASQVEGMAVRLFDKLYSQALDMEDPARAEAFQKWAKESQSTAQIRGLLRFARSEPTIRILESELDSDRNLVAVANGTLELQSGKLLTHNPEHLLTKYIPILYDSAAKCPRWDAFLDEIFDSDRELLMFVRRAFGYMFLGRNTEQVVFMFWGRGANGKSTLLRVIAYVFGVHAMSASADTFSISKVDRHIRNDLQRLQRARMVVVTESGKGKVLDEETIKRLSGGDEIAERELYHEHTQFTAGFSIVFVTNDKPKIQGTDHAIWRRPLLIPCTVTIPPERMDKHLTEKLQAEASGILNWLLAGAAEYQKIGLCPPLVVRDATAEYRGEEDPLFGFVHENLAAAPGDSVLHANVFDAWCEYKKRCELPKLLYGSHAALAKEMGQRGFERKRTNIGMEWVGLQLRENGRHGDWND